MRCRTCNATYSRTYEEHTGDQRHRDAVAVAVGRAPKPERKRGRTPTTQAGKDLADGERDGLTALIVEIEDQAREEGRLQATEGADGTSA